jgi:hypothetical protein
MANKWVEHVRKWSADHGVSYMCATGMPACKEAYQKGKAPKNTQKANREQMGMEDKDVALPKKAKKGITADTLKDKISQIKEAKKMGIEDIKSAMLRRAQGIVQPVQSADTAVVKPKGRPKKYETAEEARRMKSVKTVEARNRRRAEKAKAVEVATPPKAFPLLGEDIFDGMTEKEKVLTRGLIAYYKAQDDDHDEFYSEGRDGNPVERKGAFTALKNDIADKLKLPKKTWFKLAGEVEDKYRINYGNYKQKTQAMRGRGYEGMQEVTDDELFRTMALGGRVMDNRGNMVAVGGAHADHVDNYSMIINHLVEHISDPSEPVDPRDYDQAIHFIREMRRAKGGAELYSREYSPRYGGAMYGGDLGDDLRKGLHEAGKPFSILGVNPGSTGFDLGRDVIAPAMMKTKWGNPKTGIFSKSFWTPKKKHH